MKQVFLLALVATTTASSLKAQTYEHYRYNNAGVAEKTGYTKVQQPVQYAPYVPSVDVNAYRESSQAYQQAILQKQQIYNRNVQSIQTLISAIADLSIKLKSQQPELSKSLSDLLLSYMPLLNSGNYDFSDERVYRRWYDELNKVYTENYKALQ